MASRRVAVADASPIIAFHSAGRLDLLEQVLPVLVVPPRVARVVAPSVGVLPSWIVERPLSIRPPALLEASSLDPGEYEAIALALELNAAPIVLDDLAARRVAERLGLSVVGAFGLAIRAKTAGLVPAVRPVIDDLIATGLYVSPALYAELLSIAGESD